MITWTIESMDRNISDGGVFAVRWKCTKSEDLDGSIFSVDYEGITILNPDSQDSSFVEYDSLTEEVVLDWIHSDSKLKRDTEREVEFRYGVESQEFLRVASGLPW